MNADQRKNVDEMVEALGRSMARAWSYFYVLKGFHEGAKASPEVGGKFGWLLTEVWRGLFDAFFAKVGTLIDASSSTYSLPNLIKLVRRYGDADLKALIPEAEACLSEQAGPIAKIRNWRHAHVAHRTTRGDQDAFYAENSMNLAQIDVALKQLNEAINHLSWNVLGIHSDTNSAFEGLVAEGLALFKATARGMEAPK